MLRKASLLPLILAAAVTIHGEAAAETWTIVDLGTELASPADINDQGVIVGGDYKRVPLVGLARVTPPDDLFCNTTVTVVDELGGAGGVTGCQENGPGSPCPGSGTAWNVNSVITYPKQLLHDGTVVGSCEGACLVYSRKNEACAAIGSEIRYLRFEQVDATDDVANAINASGKIVGGASKNLGGTLRRRAFIYDSTAGTMTDLGTLGGQEGIAYDINDSGVVVGSSTTAGGDTHAFVYTSQAGMVDLHPAGATNSEALSVNNAGWIVGRVEWWGNEIVRKAFLFRPSGGQYAAIDLGSMIESSLGWELESAIKVNARGELLGSGTKGGEARGFLMRPSEGTTAVNNDFDGDAQGDFTVWRPSLGMWFIRKSSASSGAADPYLAKQWGLPGDLPVRGDYDGDDRLDLAVFRPATGMWYICRSQTNFDCTQGLAYQFGLPGDYPLPADFDGDGRLDLVVWRPYQVNNHAVTQGYWYVRRSSDGLASSRQWGLNGDLPAPADYDGDGVADYAVWRPSTGVWWMLLSTRNFSGTAGDIAQFQWGLPGDHPLPADLNADGMADLVVWRPSTGIWYACFSPTFNCAAGVGQQWGLPGDMPVAGAYDGTAAADLTVWRPLLPPIIGTWFSTSLGLNSYTTMQWGLPGDIPIGIGIKQLMGH